MEFEPRLVIDAVDIEVTGQNGIHESEHSFHPCVTGAGFGAPASVDLVAHIKADHVLVRTHDPCQLAHEYFLRRPT